MTCMHYKSLFHAIQHCFHDCFKWIPTIFIPVHTYILVPDVSVNKPIQGQPITTQFLQTAPHWLQIQLGELLVNQMLDAKILPAIQGPLVP